MKCSKFFIDDYLLIIYFPFSILYRLLRWPWPCSWSPGSPWATTGSSASNGPTTRRPSTTRTAGATAPSTSFRWCTSASSTLWSAWSWSWSWSLPDASYSAAHGLDRPGTNSKTRPTTSSSGTCRGLTTDCVLLLNVSVRVLVYSFVYFRKLCCFQWVIFLTFRFSRYQSCRSDVYKFTCNAQHS